MSSLGIKGLSSIYTGEVETY